MTELDEAWWSRVLGGPGGSLHVSSSSERYVLLPRASDPRVVVDIDDPQAMKDAVNRSLGSRGMRGMKPLAGGATAILSRRRPSWSVDSPDGTLREYLSDILEQEVRLSIAVGPPRPNLKPVVRCYADSRLIAVAKMGPDPHTAAMVDNEARWLDTMAAQPLSGTVTPPLLHRGQYGTSEVLVTRALDLVEDLAVSFDEVPIEVIKELSERFADSVSVSESAYFYELRRRLDRPELASIAAQAASLREESTFSELAVSAWHGDWSPWNMGRLQNGKLCIWDWERSTVGVPTGFDIVHLHFQYGSGLAAADADLARIGIPDSHWNLLKRLYLFELCARHGEGEALGTEIHQRVLDALDGLRQERRA